jgi:hypothetical protein
VVDVYAFRSTALVVVMVRRIICHPSKTSFDSQSDILIPLTAVGRHDTKAAAEQAISREGHYLSRAARGAGGARHTRPPLLHAVSNQGRREWGYQAPATIRSVFARDYDQPNRSGGAGQSYSAARLGSDADRLNSTCRYFPTHN